MSDAQLPHKHHPNHPKCALALGDVTRVIEPILHNPVTNTFSDQELARAWMMQAFLLTDRGAKPDEIKAAWLRASKIVPKPTQEGGLHLYLIARSFAEVAEPKKDFQLVLDRALYASETSSIELIRQFGGSELENITHEMWQSEQGQIWARKIIFRSHKRADQIAFTPTLAVYEYVRQKAFSRRDDPELMKILFATASRGVHLATEGVASYSNEIRSELWKLALSAMVSWKDPPLVGNPKGMRDLVEGLPEEYADLRASVAYVAAHRMILRGKLDAAGDFFNLAEKHLQAQQLNLRTLVRIDQELLAKKQGILTEVSGSEFVARNLQTGVETRLLGKSENRLNAGRYRVEPSANNPALPLPSKAHDVTITPCCRMTLPSP